jgi:hypothetical protein
MNLLLSLILIDFKVKKINHIHKFASPIKANMNIVRPIFYHQNETIQIFNPQS